MLVSKMKIVNGRVIVKDSKTMDKYANNGIYIGRGKLLYEEGDYAIVQYGDGIALLSKKGAMIKYPSLEAAKNRLKKAIQEGSLNSKDSVDPTKPKNIAAAKSLSVAQGKAASDGGPGSGQKGHKSAHHIPDPSTHKERRKERANLQKYIENARRSGNIKEAQKHSQRLAHINSLQLKG